jgi:membrane peptidoglycan carboxypeptidase
VETATAAPRRRPGAVAVHRPRRLRRLVRALVGVVLTGIVLLVVVWQLTPGVDDAQGRVAARLGAHSAPALAGPVPADLAAALIATEDSSFATNPGVDPRGVLRVAQGLVTGADLGGSTLEQQLAKNLYEDGRTGPVERVAEVVLALKLAHTWDKDTLLRMYLDDGYYGHGFYGVTAAAEGYFDVEPAELSWAQSTLLAGLFQAPSADDPLQYPDRAAARQAHVLDRLVDVGTLTRAQAEDVARRPWKLTGAG